MSSPLSKIDFGNEAGDDPKAQEELEYYFVEQPAFASFKKNTDKLLIAHARKGVGKSNLLQWIFQKVSESDQDAIVIKCRGADVVRSVFNLTTPLSTPNDYIRDWMVRLCSLINRRIGTEIKFAFNDDDITLVEAAELQGYKSRNIVSCLLDRFKAYLAKGPNAAPQKLTVTNEIEMFRRNDNRKVWILIDDLDATFQNTPSELLELATFFSACRYLLQDHPELCIRITVRSDVWAVLRRYDESLDKVDQYVREILWTQHEFLELLSKRVSGGLELAGVEVPKVPKHVDKTDAMEKMIENVLVPKMEWADGLTDSYKVIYTLSYERPRWAVQLCKLAKEDVLRNGAQVISKGNIDNIWGDYGSKRIADLVSEHKHQCPQVNELLNSFRGASKRMTRDQLFSWINRRVCNHMDTAIEGKSTRSPMEIAHFLYKLGFIVARSDAPDGRGYEHYRFNQMPDFLSSRTDDDFGLSWEIHPCYREALDIKKIDKSHKEQFGKMRKRK